MTPKWSAVKRHCEARIETLRTALEQADATEGETQVIRGKIAAYRDLLGMEPRQTEPVASPPPYD